MPAGEGTDSMLVPLGAVPVLSSREDCQAILSDNGAAMLQ